MSNRNEPEKILSRERARLGVSAHRATVRKSHQHSHNQKNNSCNYGQNLRLIEHPLRFFVVLSSDRVRHGGRRADAEHLCKGEHDKGEVPCYSNGCDSVRAEPANPIEVDEEIQRLEDHRHEHEARGLQQMSAERSGGEVFHGVANVAGAQQDGGSIAAAWRDPMGTKSSLARLRLTPSPTHDVPTLPDLLCCTQRARTA